MSDDRVVHPPSHHSGTEGTEARSGRDLQVRLSGRTLSLARACPVLRDGVSRPGEEGITSVCTVVHPGVRTTPAATANGDVTVMDIYGFLAKNGIGYERHDHPAVFTCEEAERFVPPLPAAKTKNLLFRDKKGRRHFLVVVGYEKEVDTGSLASVLGVGKLSLASPERLRRYLGVDPGSVTILAVVNDPEGRVEIVMDEALWGSGAFRCHPLVNTSTLVVSRGDLVRFFDITGHRVRVIDIPGKSSLPPLGKEGTLG